MFGFDNEISRNIPNSVKAAVRKKCGFGCVFCGSPIFHYDHLEDFSVVKRHDLENINLLCPNHHQSKTSGRISKMAVAKAAADPVNLSSRKSSEGMPLNWASPEMVFVLGSNASFTNQDIRQFTAIKISGQTLASCTWTDGWLKLNLRITNLVGDTLLNVEDGELFTNTEVHDFNAVGNRITIVAGPEKLVTELFIGDGQLVVSKGCFSAGGSAIVVNPTSMTIGMVRPSVNGPVFVPTSPPMRECHNMACLAGVVIG